MATTIYSGRRTGSGCRVTMHDAPKGLPRRLPMRLDLFNHSPTGFEWGYAGSGPAQLALALLAHALADDERAVRLHQQFKFKVVGAIKRDHWEMTRDEIVQLAAAIETDALLPLRGTP